MDKQTVSVHVEGYAALLLVRADMAQVKYDLRTRWTFN